MPEGAGRFALGKCMKSVHMRIDNDGANGRASAGRMIFAAAFAVLVWAGSASAYAPVGTTPAVKAALAKLESQLPLTAADHTALKEAAKKLKVDSLRACADPGNMPLSSINLDGYQNKIMSLVAEAMGASVTYFWRPYFARGLTRQTFETNDCDILLDVPATFDLTLTSQPIYRTTYVFATRTDRNLKFESFDDPRLKELRVGVYQTSSLRTVLAYRGVQKNVSLHVLSHDADLREENQPWHQVQKVIDGQLDVAGVWGPFAGWLQKKGAPITVQPVNLIEDEIPLEFDLSFGLRKTDYILMYKLDLALDEKKAEIEKILRDYGVPLVQCSRCFVAGDLPAHGIYTKPIAEPKPIDVTKLSPDQRVTRERLEAWLADGANVDQELANAVLAADPDRIKFLIEKGAKINKRDPQGYAAIHSAARGRKEALVALLISLGADVNQPDKDGLTALHHAIMRDHPGTVSELAKHGADLNALAPGGFTPLSLAIVEDRYKAAIALIAAGAPIEARSGPNELTALMVAAGKEGYRPSLGAGKDRIEKLHPKDPGTMEIATALIQRGADVNAVSKNGVTALMLAAAHNITPMVGLLVQAGADPQRKTPDGKTAADLAQSNGNTSVVSVLRLLEQSGSN